MAKVLLGSMLGQISGSLGGSTWSHNRSGYYIRQRVKPVVVQTYFTALQRNNFTSITCAWAALDTHLKLAWENYAHNNPVTDRMGQTGILTGHQSFVKINLTTLRNGGVLTTIPPIATAPTALTNISLTADIGAGKVELAWTPTPLGTNDCIQIRGAVMDSDGPTYVKNRYKLLYYASAAQISPLDIQVNVEDRFGTMSTGQKLHLAVSVASKLTGLQSGSRLISATVTST